MHAVPFTQLIIMKGLSAGISTTWRKRGTSCWMQWSPAAASSLSWRPNPLLRLMNSQVGPHSQAVSFAREVFWQVHGWRLCHDAS